MKTIFRSCLGLFIALSIINFSYAQTTLVGWNFFINGTSTSGIPANSGTVISTTGTGSAPFFSGVGCGFQEAICNDFGLNDTWVSSSFSTVGYTSITYSFQHGSFTNGPTAFKFQYSLNGSTWVDVVGPYSSPVSAACSFYAPSNVAMPAAVNNQANVYIRWICTTAGGTGGNRLAQVEIKGTATCASPTVPTVSVSPTSICPNSSAALSISGTLNDATQWNVYTGSCGGTLLGTTSGSTFIVNPGTSSKTYYVRGEGGCVTPGSCGSATVTVADNIAPVVTCPGNQNLSFNNSCVGILPDYTGLAMASDNCTASPTITQSPVPGSSITSNTIVTLTATDGSGNTGSCNFIVNVSDNTNPTITCPGDQTETSNAFCQFTIPDYTGLASATDNCNPSPTITQSPAAGTIVSGNTLVTLTANDGNGNSANCNFTVFLSDATPPTAVCQNINVYLDGSGNASIIPIDIDGGSTDNCSGLTYSASATSFTCANVGANAITLTVTDASFNSSNCMAVVTVLDTVSPTILCPGNQLENLTASCNFTLPDYTGLVSSSDNCGFVIISQSPSPGTVITGTTLVTMTSMDASGNSNTCSFNVIVNDNTPPTALCQNITIYLDNAGNASIAAADIDGGSSDDCSNITLTASQTSFTCANVGANTVMLTVMDGSGNSSNCTATVTVVDNTSPTITCPGDQTETASASCDFVLPDYTGLVTATDPCGIAAIAQSPAPGTVITGNQLVTMTAYDQSGNNTICSFNVLLSGATPTAVCQNATIVIDANGTATLLPSDIDGGSTTPCGSPILSVSQANFTCADIGANVVTLTVTDVNGNMSTCDATVTVTESTLPTASNPAPMSAECVATIPAPDPSVVTDAADNCGVTTVTWSSDVSDGQSCPETITRTYTVSDLSGNSIDVAQTITVMDVTPPTASNPSTVSVQCSTNIPSPSPSWVTTEADNCTTNPVVAWVSDVSDGLSCPETITRTFSVTDDCGNAITVTQTIIVNDITAPTPDNPSLPEETAFCNVTLTPPTATDLCAGTITGTTTTVFPINTMGTTTVTWTFTDDCGNATSQTQDVTITSMNVGTWMANDGVTIVASNITPGVTYQWIDCLTNQDVPGATNHNFKPTYGGEFAVVVTQDGCSDTSACVISTVGIDELTAENVVLYPNPTSGIFTIAFNGQIQSVEVVDVLGRVIEIPTSKEQSSVDVSTLAPGKYFVRITTTADQTLIKEFILQK